MAKSDPRVPRVAVAASLGTVLSAVISLLAWLGLHPGSHATVSVGAATPPPAATVQKLPLDSQPVVSMSTATQPGVPSEVVTSASPSYSMQFSGQITITAYGIALDPVPPQQETYAEMGAGDVRFDGGSVWANGNVVIAKWTGQTTAGPQQCSDWVSTNGVNTTVDVDSGNVVCVKTVAGRIAALMITGVDLKSNHASAMATVWNLVR